MKVNKIDLAQLHKKLQIGNVYLFYEYEDCVVKFSGTQKFVKFRGESEFLAKEGSNVVAQAIMDCMEISEIDYNEF